MLVTFKTSAYADITLFGTAAVSLLKMMGQSGNVPGALLAADIPQALHNLHEALAKLSEQAQHSDAQATTEKPTPQSTGHSEDDENRSIGLHTRAGPLVSLLEAASASGENVMWDS